MTPVRCPGTMRKGVAAVFVVAVVIDASDSSYSFDFQPQDADLFGLHEEV